MTEKELNYIKTITEEKSISKAARKLFISQPSLSQYVRRIETELGTELFKRTPAGLIPTYAGEQYYRTALKILALYEDLEREISDINGLKTGKIHLGITSHLGTGVLSRVLPPFHRQFPGIECVVTEETSYDLEEKLARRELDFAIMHAPKKATSSDLSYELLSRDPFLVVAPHGHPIRRLAITGKGELPELDLVHLRDQTFLMVRRSQRIRQITDSLLAAAGITQPNILMTLKSFETVQLLCAEGMGFTLLPRQYAALPYLLTKPDYYSIPESYGAYWELCIATPKDAYLSLAGKRFLDMVRQFCREGAFS